MKIKSTRHGLLASTTFCSALLMGLAASSIFSGVAQAQDEAKPADEPKEITVVGSRIRKDTFNAASPITVITRDEATAAGLTSTSAILQGTSVTNGSSQINNAWGGYVTDGGPGANTIGLRGLGPGRTLVMINGRRVAPAGTRGSVGAADLNVLPNALIGRIEVLRDGASAIYGSDAIGGVVNVITRNVKGLELEFQANAPVHVGGEQFRVSAVAGKSFGRLNVQGSLEYYERTDLALKDRSWTQCNTDYSNDPVTGQPVDDYIDPLTGKPKCYPITYSSGGSNGVTINTLGTPSFAGVAAQGALGTSFNRWRPNSAVATGLTGYEGVSGAAGVNVRDTFDKRTLNQSLISPAKITTAFGQATYQLPEFSNSELYGELLVNHRSSSQVGYRQLSVDYATGSMLIPANIAAIPGSFLAAGGTVLYPGATKARAFVGFGNYTSSQEANYIKATGGIRGDVAFLPGWQYDAFVMFSKNDANYTQDTFLTDRLSKSVQVSAPVAGVSASLIRPGFTAGTSYTCNANNAAPSTASCVPAPLLTSAFIGGVMPADWVNYIFQPVTGNTQYDEFTFSADMNGTLLSLPAGPVKAAVGVEYRKAKINDQPPADSVSGNLYNLTSAAPTVGEDSVVELYTELNIPVLKDLPFAKALNFELAGRYTDYESYGEDTTYKAGVVYTPFDFFTLRATKGSSFRAPALYEQFLGGTSGFAASTNDPCNSWDSLPAASVRRANCAAEGLPAGYAVGNGNNSSIKVVTNGGAAQGLIAETSDNLTVGAVLKATFLPKETFGDWSLAVDYFDIKIENGIDRAGYTSLLSLCYNNTSFRAGGSYCAFSTRDPVTKALTVYDSYTNISIQTVKGFDYTLRFKRDFGKVGITANAKITKFDQQGVAKLATDPITDYNGLLNNPDMTGTFDLAASYNKWKFRYFLDWVGAMDSSEYYGVERGVDPYTLFTPDYFVQHLSVEYKTADWTAKIGVRNLADVVPPSISSCCEYKVGNAPLYSGYDYIGREIFFNFTKTF